ncbi:unnamed protein product [Ectocarpus sp. 12 AP-2014]
MRDAAERIPFKNRQNTKAPRPQPRYCRCPNLCRHDLSKTETSDAGEYFLSPHQRTAATAVALMFVVCIIMKKTFLENLVKLTPCDTVHPERNACMMSVTTAPDEAK